MTKHIEEIVEKMVQEYKSLMASEVMTVWDEKTGDEVFMPDWLKDTLTTLAIKIHEEAIKELGGRKYVFEREKDDYLPEVYKHLKSKNEALDEAITYHQKEINKLKK